jgi:TetR/AcrR family transcriptional regulator, transcriptional repressor for nem operon
VARQKDFSPDIALDRAMALFRSSGYEAVSTAELCDAMGIARQSMYDTFGDKAALYEAALRRYQSTSRASVHECMDGHSPLAAIAAVFDMVADLPAAERRNGCMLVNAIGELVAIDSTVASIAKANQRSLIALFADTVRSGQAAGEMNRDLDPDEAATQLMTSFYGLRVMAKVDPSSPATATAARNAVHFLRAD